MMPIALNSRSGRSGSSLVDASFLPGSGGVWLPRLVVAAVVILSAVLAAFASPLVLVALLAVGALVAFVRWPATGMLALLIASLVVPIGIGTGTETEINAAVILVALLTGLWLLEMVLRRDIRLSPSRPLLPLFVFSAASTLSFVVGLQPWLAFAQTAPIATQLGGLAIFLLSFCCFLLAAHRIPNARILEVLVWTFVLLGTVYMISRLHFGFPVVAKGADGSMFWVWLTALAFSQALLNRKLPLLIRWALFALVGLTLYVGLSNKDWNSGWTPPLVAIGLILLIAKPRLAIATILVGAIGVLWKLPTVMQLFVTNDYKQYDWLTRTAAWDILMNIIKLEPIMGTGFGNYYWYTPLYPILGYNVRFNSHNNYVDLAAETGVVGLACFAWLMLEIGVVGWRLRKRVPEGFQQAYVYGAFGGLVATLVAAFLGDWVLPFVYNIGMTGFRASILAWIFLGGLLAVERSVTGADVGQGRTESSGSVVRAQPRARWRSAPSHRPRPRDAI